MISSISTLRHRKISINFKGERMASRIKGLTVEIGGDTTGLQKALQGVNGKIKTPSLS